MRPIGPEYPPSPSGYLPSTPEGSLPGAVRSEDVVYAIIRSGGKQYRVAEGDRLQVERDVLGSADQDKVTFSEVLMIGGDQPKVGDPTVKGATVVATVVRETRGDKIIVFKKKRRKNHTKRTHGHRQDVVEVRIDTINV